MSNVNDPLDDLLDHPESPTEAELSSILTGVASLPERLRLIDLALSNEDHIELFGHVWDELRPDEEGLDARTALTELRRLNEAIMSGPEQLQQIATSKSSPEWLAREAQTYRNAMLSGLIAPSAAEASWITAPLAGRAITNLTAWDKFQKQIQTLKSRAIRSLMEILPKKVGGHLDDKLDVSKLVFTTCQESGDRASAWRSSLVKADVKIEVLSGNQTGYHVTVTYGGTDKVQEAAMVMTFRNEQTGEEYSTVTYLERDKKGLWGGEIPRGATEVGPGLSLVNTEVVFKQ